VTPRLRTLDEKVKFGNSEEAVNWRRWSFIRCCLVQNQISCWVFEGLRLGPFAV